MTQEEIQRIEVADFGLNDLETTGLELITYVNTSRCCAKGNGFVSTSDLPEHRHPPVGDEPGKEETFRCRWGKVYLYVEGEPVKTPAATPPKAERIHILSGMRLSSNQETNIYNLIQSTGSRVERTEPSFLNSLQQAEMRLIYLPIRKYNACQ